MTNQSPKINKLNESIKGEVAMKMEVDLSNVLENELKKAILTSIRNAVDEFKANTTQEWMTLKEGAEYAGVSYNTFIKFRKLGMCISEVAGVKRVSRAQIDEFLNQHSF